jgi:hypothetical protein
MEDSLFVELVRALTAQEKAEVLQFSELTSMNSGKMKRFVRPLLEYCFQFDWGAKESLPSREQVYRAVFGDEEMVEGKCPN